MTGPNCSSNVGNWLANEKCWNRIKLSTISVVSGHSDLAIRRIPDLLELASYLWSLLRVHLASMSMHTKLNICAIIKQATLDGTSLKLVDKFTFTNLGSSVSSTKKDIDTRLTKAWTAIDRISTIWKWDLTDKMKRCFFRAAVVSILLYGCTTWTLTKRLEKKLDGNYTRMLRAILN